MAEVTAPPEYRHLSGEDLAEAMECEQANDVEYLKKVRRRFLFENWLDTFKRLARKGKLEEELEVLFGCSVQHIWAQAWQTLKANGTGLPMKSNSLRLALAQHPLEVLQGNVQVGEYVSKHGLGKLSFPLHNNSHSLSACLGVVPDVWNMATLRAPSRSATKTAKC